MGDPVQETVSYADLVYPAEQKSNGELSLGTDALLREGSWGLYINKAEQMAIMKEAAILCSAEPLAVNCVAQIRDFPLSPSLSNARGSPWMEEVQVLDIDQRACKTWCGPHHDLAARIATKGQFSTCGGTANSKNGGETAAIAHLPRSK